jgi:RNA polymerase sigma-70 factor (ECF subfamily)
MPRNSSVTDSRLIRRSQQGDRRAFRALLTRYDWRLRGLAHALLLDPEHVDAVLRVAYVKAWREVVRIDGRDDASGWLYRVVYNACIDALRREGTRIGPAPAGGNGSTPAGVAQDRQARVVEALASLAPTDRVAVVLVDREGFSPGAAARILGLAPEILGARLVGARARLTEHLAQVPVAAPAPAAEAGAQPDGPAAKADKPQAQPAEAPAEEGQPEEARADAGQPEDAPPDDEVGTDGPQADEAQRDEPASEDAEPEQTPPEEQAPAAEPPPADAPAPVAATEPKADAAAEAEAEDSTPAEPEDAKVASRSAAGASPNGANGAARSNGSDDAGGGGS